MPEPTAPKAGRRSRTQPTPQPNRGPTGGRWRMAERAPESTPAADGTPGTPGSPDPPGPAGARGPASPDWRPPRTPHPRRPRPAPPPLRAFLAPRRARAGGACPQPLVRRLARPAPQPRLHRLGADDPLPRPDLARGPASSPDGDPLSCDLAKAQEPARARPPLRLRPQGCDVYTRVVYGARTSVTVGVCATLGVALSAACSAGSPGSSAAGGTR